MGLRLAMRVTNPYVTNLTPTVLSVSSKRAFGHYLVTITRPSVKKLGRTPPSSSSTTSSLSSFFTPSLCRISSRYASTAAGAQATPKTLDWNTFFHLRTSRRRYALTSSIFSAILTTGAMFVFLSTQPEMADQMTKLIPTDPFISLGIATFGATAVGWLLGPMFGNGLWRLLHRSKLIEFTSKEKAFFERIKRHRVNPFGASTNNPVPDFYGEKIGSVSGYRRWLKDQRAFNRKRDGIYTT